MRAAERSVWAAEDPPQPPRPVGTAVLGLFAMLVAIWPYTSVVEAGAWTFVVTTVVIAVVLVGGVVRALLARRGGTIRALATLAAQLLAALLLLTWMLLPQTTALVLLPSPTTAEAFARLAVRAAGEVYAGSAPLADTQSLRAVLGAAFAVVAILIDHLVVLRRALLTAVLVTVVGALPTIIVLGDANVIWFIVLAVLVLMLLRHAAVGARGVPGSALAALGSGAVAVLICLIVTPALPISASWAVPAPGVSIDATLRLGDDLRRPDPVRVMTLATSEKSAPYLRVATLSHFNGRVWAPDGGEPQSLSDGFGDPDWNDDVLGAPHQTSIRVFGLTSARLPVPYAARRITGVGDEWLAVPENRTVLTRTGSASGEDYTVTTETIQPSLEQITAASASDGSADVADLPPVIAETAAEVTADADDDYDRLIALQDWFRSEFDYSVDTPVDEDFDGTGADAVARFLEVRSGYCIHFAGAFALMAQTLGMPVRIVVGYLPGELTDERRGDEYVYAVMSDQLHAWPEVHFDGIGWVPFEPTATLGVPTAFAPSDDDPSGGADAPEPTPSASAAPAPTSGPDAEQDLDRGGDSDAAAPLQQLNPAPIVLVAAAVLVVVLLPMLLRLGRRMLRLLRARSGDAGAAWRELQDTLVDLGLAPSDAQTPRERARELTRDRGADAEALGVLVSAIEHASYARAPGAAVDLAAPLRAVLGQVSASVDPRIRVGARLMPRSLITARPRRSVPAR